MKRILHHTFGPIAGADPVILILGSFPGAVSLSKNEYYGNPRNSFWKIIFDLFGKTLTDNYKSKKALLKRNGIALWDVLMECEREGSLDSNIKNGKTNDIRSFLDQKSSIKTVFFNGKGAERFYKKFIGLDEEWEFITLPSTSPAHQRLNYEEKLGKWKAVKKSLLR